MEISCCRMVILLAVWAGITLAVGLMAGLINKGDCQDEATTPGPDGTTSSGPDESTTKPPPAGPWGDPFLREYVKPMHYDLHLYPDFYFDGNTFYGEENITVRIEEEPTEYIILHINFMDISETRLWDASTLQEIDIENAFHYEKNQYWVVETKEVLALGDYVLHLKFSGSLTNGIVGYYKSTYVNSDTGVESWLATSKFQPSDARKAYPNWDEPKFKATFNITLRHWQNFTAISNMPVLDEVLDGDIWQETSFEKTPLMSSYLTCFIVFDFVSMENTLANGKPHRVWAPPDRINQAQLALDFGKASQDFMEEEMDMIFHLPKLDEVAVPDYPSGATEHWGIITYRESRMLYDEATAGASDASSVRNIVAHEVAHHFFGNAITCKSWDDIWLNEGYARYYQYIIVDHINPEYESEDNVLTAVVQPVMSDDALTDSRPVSMPVTTPEEATAAFSGIVYSKGAALLRMMEDFLGKEMFRNATRYYLKKYEFGVVTTEDMYATYSEYTGVDLTTIMYPWTLQMGLPVLEVTEENNLIKLTPKRFLTDPDADPNEPESEYNYQWYIPVSYETENGVTGRKWVNLTEGTFDDPRSDPSTEWLKLNTDQKGYFRTNYAKEQWQKLSAQLENNHTVLANNDRAMILDDAFNLARATQLDYPTALDLTKYLDKEEHYFPWSSVRLSLNYISDMMYGVGGFSQWREYMQATITPMMNKVKVEGDGEHLDVLNRRNNIMPLACRHGQMDCLVNTTRMFEDWLADESNEINPNIRRVVYQYGMLELSGVEGVWDTVLDRFEKTPSVTEKGNLMYTLAQTDRQWLINRYLEYAMDENNIKEQDFFTIINYLAYNLDSNRYVWDWVRANYEHLLERFDLADRYFGRMVPNIVSGYNTEFLLDEVLAFYAKYPEAGAGAVPRAESLASIRSNIAWMNRNLQAIIDWLADNGY